MRLETVNINAMEAALRLMGVDLEIATKTYKALDHVETIGFQAGFEMGVKLAQEEATAGRDEYINDAIEIERAVADMNVDEASDDGFLEGVQTARTNPAFADRIVEGIIARREMEEAHENAHLEGERYDFSDEDVMPVAEFYEGDSGDETDYDAVCAAHAAEADIAHAEEALYGMYADPRLVR